MVKKSVLPINLKNLLRGAKSPYSALSDLRPTVSTRLYPALMEYLPTIVRNGYAALNPPFPPTYNSLVKLQRVLTPISLEREFLWTANRILHNKDKINLFVDLKSQFESAVWSGDVTTAEQRLEEIESNFGVSFFLIETKLALLQQLRGLEQQKAYLSKIRAQISRGLVPFIAFWISQKNELATNPSFFPARFVVQLQNYDLPDGIEDYIKFRVLGVVPDAEGLANLLRWDHNAALVDQFETLIAILQASHLRIRDADEALRLLVPHILDPRIRKLTVLCEVGQGGINYDETQLRAQNALDMGNPSLALEVINSSSDHVHNPLRAVAEAAARAELGSPAEHDQTRASKSHIVSLLTKIFAKRGDYDDALLEIIRLIECFPALSFSATIRPAVWFSVADEPLVSWDHLTASFIASRYMDPASMAILPTSVKANVADELKGRGYELANELQGAPKVDGLELQSEFTPPSDLPFMFKVRSAVWNGQNAKVLDLIGNAPATLPRTLRRELIRSSVHADLNLREVDAALEKIASAYLDDSAMLQMLPITKCVEALTESDIDQFSGRLSLTIVYDLYLRNFGEERAYVRNDSYDDFLIARGYTKPSDLPFSLQDVSSSFLIYFLRYVCIPEVMLNSGSFSSSKELEDERLRVLAVLREADPTNASDYDTEVREITRKQIIQQGVRHVEQSKLAMDTQPLRRWAEKHLRESFTRFKALREAGVKSQKEPVVVISGAAPLNIPDTPVDEASDLLSSMMLAFLLESFTNSFYGLDSYLSMRTRHGSFAGQIRAALEEDSIITLRDGLSDDYKPNQYWLNRIGGDGDSLRSIDKVLKSFARSFDSTIKSFADTKLQIRSPEKPDGIFRYTVETFDVVAVSVEIISDDTFDRFVDQCLLVFWENVEACLEFVRSEIDLDLKAELNLQINRLLADLEPFKESVVFIGDLITAVLNGQTRLQQSIEGLKGWFHTPKPVSQRLFTIDEIIDISLQQVKKLHPNFDPIVVKKIAIDFDILELTRFSDVFFIIFENIQRHSGVGSSPNVEITVKQGNRLLIEVLSEMVPNIETEAKLEHLRQIIAAGQYQKIVKSEGGTGLVKLWNVINVDDSRLEFGIVDGKFRVFTSFPVSWVNFSKELT